MSAPLHIREARAHDRDLLAQWAVAMAMETEHKALDEAVVRAGMEAGIADPAKARYFIAMRESTVAGRETIAMPAGTFITIGIGAANRDPAEFADPDRLDLGREPNRHLAFGSGAHICAGLNVARLEGRIAIGRFLARFPDYRLAGEPVRGGRARFRGFLSIPVAL